LGGEIEPPESKATGRRGWWRVFVVFGLLIGVFAGTVVTQSLYQRRPATDVMAGYGLPFIESPQEHFHKDRVSLLLLGIDYDYDAKDQETSSNARADTIKAVSLNLPTSQNPNGSISLLSIPRDTDAVLPDGRENKINAGYGGFNGNYEAAAHNQARVVANFLGLPKFDRYLTLRIDATKAVIDAIGGIDVTPDETMNYDDNWGHLHIHFIGGKKYHMNGEQAVSYARFRHDACSDPCRIKRQDQVIKLTVAKLKNDKFNDLLHINALIDVMRRNVYTDLSQREILSLAWAFQHIDLKKIDTQQIPFVSDKALNCCGNVLVADDAAKARLVKKMFLDSASPPSPADPTAVAAVPAEKIHIAVRNGSGVAGEGVRVAEALRKEGFVIDSITNAPSFAYDATEIRFNAAAPPLAGERVRSALAVKTATVEPEASTASPAVGSDVVVIVGRDLAVSQREASTVR